jgi:predicted secreted protein
MGIRLRFAETSTIRVVAIANGRAYHAITEIKITAGGCGS